MIASNYTQIVSVVLILFYFLFKITG